jgi:probable F420-dependent oxidoreductase
MTTVNKDIRFGVQYNGASMAGVIGPLEFAEMTEGWGYDAYFVPDLETLNTLDPLVLLASVAQRTKHMLLGVGVLIVPFRSPYQLAKTATSVDVLSDGRLLLGLGTGLLPHDFHVEQVDRRKRGKITDEAIGIVRQLLNGETVNHKGEFYELSDTTLAPQPTRQTPIWLGGTWDGGFAEAALRRMARFGDGFHPHEVPVEGYAQAIQRIGELAAEYGRDASSFDYACNMWLNVAGTKDDAIVDVQAALNKRFGADAWPVDPAACYALGSPADCIETIQAYVDIGVRTFVMNGLAAPDRMLPNYQAFAREVIPHFRS